MVAGDPWPPNPARMWTENHAVDEVWSPPSSPTDKGTGLQLSKALVSVRCVQRPKEWLECVFFSLRAGVCFHQEGARCDRSHQHRQVHAPRPLLFILCSFPCTCCIFVCVYEVEKGDNSSYLVVSWCVSAVNVSFARVPHGWLCNAGPLSPNLSVVSVALFSLSPIKTSIVGPFVAKDGIKPSSPKGYGKLGL